MWKEHKVTIVLIAILFVIWLYPVVKYMFRETIEPQKMMDFVHQVLDANDMEFDKTKKYVYDFDKKALFITDAKKEKASRRVRNRRYGWYE